MEKIYQEYVRKADAKGNKDIFKEAFELFKRELAKDKYTVKDEEYHDGYFIFGTGTNSIVHFHIKQAPEFLFGIWWDTDYKKGDDYLKGSLYSQYENNIDKFKPSASMFCEDVMVNVADPVSDSAVIYPRRIIEFIVKEPALSWYKDNFYADFNEEYVSREEAEATYKQFKKHKKLEEKLVPELNKQYLDAVIKEINKEFTRYAIIDEGDYTWPRYSLLTYDKKSKPGHYEMFAKESDSYEKLNKLKQKLISKAKESDIFWDAPIDLIVMITTEKKYKKTLSDEEISFYKINGETD